MNRRLFLQGLLGTALVSAATLGTRARAASPAFLGADFAEGPDVTAIYGMLSDRMYYFTDDFVFVGSCNATTGKWKCQS